MVVQLGDISDTDFQSAIVLSAYGDGAPSLIFYQGINSYSLSGKDIVTIGYDRVKKRDTSMCMDGPISVTGNKRITSVCLTGSLSEDLANSCYRLVNQL